MLYLEFVILCLLAICGIVAAVGKIMISNSRINRLPSFKDGREYYD